MRPVTAAVTVLASVAAVILSTGAALATGAVLTVLAWNVRITHNPTAVRHELRAMIAAHHPQVIELSEATRLYGRLGGLGYTVLQRKPTRDHRGLQSEDGDTAILVARGVHVDRVDVLRMRKPWRGPKAGIWHEPRTYLGIVFRCDGTTWKLGGFHLPFQRGPVAESVAAERRYSTRTLPGRPVIVLGDQNLPRASFRGRVARPAHSAVAGYGVDLAGFRNAHLRYAKRLPWHGSDHHPVLMSFRKA